MTNSETGGLLDMEVELEDADVSALRGVVFICSVVEFEHDGVFSSLHLCPCSMMSQSLLVQWQAVGKNQ